MSDAETMLHAESKVGYLRVIFPVSKQTNTERTRLREQVATLKEQVAAFEVRLDEAYQRIADLEASINNLSVFGFTARLPAPRIYPHGLPGSPEYERWNAAQEPDTDAR